MEKFRNIAAGQFRSGRPDMNKMLAGMSMVDPAGALGMMGRGKRMTDQDAKVKALTSPKAREIAGKIEMLKSEVVARRQKDPGADVTGLMDRITSLAAEFNTVTGFPYRERMLTKFMSDVNVQREYIEREADDRMKSMNKMSEVMFGEQNKKLATTRMTTDDLTKAMNLMQGTSLEEFNENPTAIQVAVKAFVKSIDNSVVNKGEIQDVVGESAIERLWGFGNKFVRGQKFSADTLNKLWESMVNVAKTVNTKLDEKKESLLDTARGEVEAAVLGGQIKPDAREAVLNNMNSRIEDRMSDLYFFKDGKIPEPKFRDINLGDVTGGGVNITKPAQGAAGVAEQSVDPFRGILD